MQYSFLKKKVFKKGSYTIIPYRREDMYSIMQWRNEQIDVLRQKKPLTEQDQDIYYQKIIEPSFCDPNTNIVLFSFLKDEKCIGYGGLTNIDWQSRRAEISFLLETKRIKNEQIYHEDFFAYLELIKEVAFKDLGFHRLFTETYDIRPLHVRILEESGFVYEGRMHDHVFINEKFIDSVMHGLVN